MRAALETPAPKVAPQGSRATPLLWLIRGYRAGLAWSPRDGRYTACVADLPGVSGRGATRTEALAALARAIDRAVGTSAC